MADLKNVTGIELINNLFHLRNFSGFCKMLRLAESMLRPNDATELILSLGNNQKIKTLSLMLDRRDRDRVPSLSLTPFIIFSTFSIYTICFAIYLF